MPNKYFYIHRLRRFSQVDGTRKGWRWQRAQYADLTYKSPEMASCHDTTFEDPGSNGGRITHNSIQAKVSLGPSVHWNRMFRFPLWATKKTKSIQYDQIPKRDRNLACDEFRLSHSSSQKRVPSPSPMKIPIPKCSPFLIDWSNFQN